MDTNEKALGEIPDEIIELGVASVETRGVLPIGNEAMGHAATPGITE